MKPEVWMLSISDNVISQTWRKFAQPTWEAFGYKVNHFEAITPDTMPDNPLTFGKKKSKIDFTLTEKAVWYSHMAMWEHCVTLDKPIICVEHDIKLLREPVYEGRVCCIAHTLRNNGAKAKLGGGAYYIDPWGAAKLCSIVDDKRPLEFNSDWWIHKNCDLHGQWDMDSSVQMQDRFIGVTVEHGRAR
jgi:hypothetical protein